MSFLDSPASSSSGTPDPLTPKKFMGILEARQAGETSGTAPPTKIPIELDTPDTANQENAHFNFPPPIPRTADDASGLSSTIPNPIELQAVDDSTMKMLRDEAERKVQSLLSGKEDRSDMANRRGEARKARKELPLSSLATNRAGTSSSTIPKEGDSLANYTSNKNDGQERTTLMLCNGMSQETDSCDQNSSSPALLQDPVLSAVRRQSASLSGPLPMMLEQDISPIRYSTSDDQPSIYPTLNENSLKYSQESEMSMMYNEMSHDELGRITSTGSDHQGLSSNRSPVLDTCHSATRIKSENQSSTSSMLKSPSKQGIEIIRHSISADDVPSSSYPKFRGGSFDYDFPLYPPMLNSTIPASTDEYSEWITNYRTKRVKALSEQDKPIDYDGEALEKAFLLENQAKNEEWDEPLSPVFDVNTSEVQYWNDQAKLGRHFCDISETTNGYKIGRGAQIEGKQSGKGCSTTFAVRSNFTVDDVFEAPSFDHADTFPHQNEFGKMNNVSPSILFSHHHSNDISDSASSTKDFMEFGHLTGENDTKDQQNHDIQHVIGSSDALEDSKVGSAVEKRAKRAHRASPISEAMRIEEMKRAAKIARKMEPEYVYDSGRLAMESFEASVEATEVDENEDGEVKIDVDGVDNGEQDQ